MEKTTPRFLTPREVAATLGLSPFELRQMSRKDSKTYDPNFPKALADGNFIAAEVFAWQKSRDALSNPPPTVIYQRDRRSVQERSGS